MEACFLKTRLNSECGDDRGKKGNVKFVLQNVTMTFCCH